jgi:hypothetical protein
LGNRISELEKKIKTLEVAGLWNVPSKLTYNSISLTFREVYGYNSSQDDKLSHFSKFQGKKKSKYKLKLLFTNISWRSLLNVGGNWSTRRKPPTKCMDITVHKMINFHISA